MRKTLLALTAVTATLMAGTALAADTVKIGLIMAYSGPFADTANQMQRGIDLYIAEHGDEVAGKKIELIKKDTGGPNPDVAKRLAQELVVRDGVDILAGFTLTPEALGAASVADQAKKMLVVMNAATSVITEKSPFVVRTSLTIPQLNYPFGKWAHDKAGINSVYTLVADYGPGHDAEKAFAKGFEEAGRQDRRRRPEPGSKPGLLGFRSAHQGCPAGSGLCVHPWRRAAAGTRQSACRAWPDAAGHQDPGAG